jgi:hypothetical protein
MTPKQILSRVRDLLRSTVWPSTTNKIFGPSAVYVVGETPMGQVSQFPRPCAFVVDQGFTNHPENPGIGTQHFSILLFIENVSHNYGEGGILGRNELLNTSNGKGTKDIGEIVLETLFAQIALSSDKVVLVSKSTTKPQYVSSNAPVYFCSLVFEAFCWVY